MKEKNDIQIKHIVLVMVLGWLLLTILKPSEEKTMKSREISNYKRFNKYLTKAYNEEFQIEMIGTDRAVIYPKKYKGTPKEKDSYYRSQVSLNYDGPGTNYTKFLFKESLNNRFRPKLEEQFGKNVIPIFDGEMAFGQSTYESYIKEKGSYPHLDGAIYIFGGIKNEKDIKKYQKGIFEFVQYLKEINNFDIVKLAFIVIDERVLEDDFEDLGIKWQLIEAKENSKTEKEFLAKREKIMSQIKITSTDKSESIEEIDRGELRKKGAYEYFSYATFGGTNAVSPKMLESDPLIQEVFYYLKGKTFDSENDLNMKSFYENLTGGK